MVIRRIYLALFLGSGALLITASWFLVTEYSAGEPFFGKPTWGDAVIFVGIPSVLAAIWVIWCVLLVALAVKRVVPLLLLIALILPIVAGTMLHTTLFGYMEDLAEAYEDNRQSTITNESESEININDD